MKKRKAAEAFNVPDCLMESYEKCRCCQCTGQSEYSQEDIEHLSLMMSLQEIGFSEEEILTYINLSENGGSREQVTMLDRKRKELLKDIHLREKQLDCLDYLRHQLKKEEEKNV